MRPGFFFCSQGVDKEYDKAMKDIQHLEAQLQEYLEQQRQRLGCKVRGLVCESLG